MYIMTKHSFKRKNKSRRHKRINSKKMFGGKKEDLTEYQKQQLTDWGFTEENYPLFKSIHDKMNLKNYDVIIVTIRAFKNQNVPNEKIIEQLNEMSDETDNEYEDEDYQNGGKMKMKKKKKTRHHKKTRHSRKQRGGTCYGSGVGANNYDPNFSIYNTRELQLFPYKP